MVRRARGALQCLARGEPHGNSQGARAIDDFLDAAARRPLLNQNVVNRPLPQGFLDRMDPVNRLGGGASSAQRPVVHAFRHLFQPRRRRKFPQPLGGALNRFREIELCPFLENRNELFEFRPGHRARHGDANGMKQVFAFFPGFLLDFLGNLSKAREGQAFIRQHLGNKRGKHLARRSALRCVDHYDL